MDRVQVDNLFPIRTNIDLLYICELAKNIRLRKKALLDVSNLEFDWEALKNTRAYAIYKGYVSLGVIVGSSLQDTDATLEVPYDNLLFVLKSVDYDAEAARQRQLSLEYNFINPKKTEIQLFEVDDSICLVYSAVNKNIFGSEEAVCNFIAYMCVTNRISALNLGIDNNLVSNAKMIMPIFFQMQKYFKFEISYTDDRDVENFIQQKDFLLTMTDAISEGKNLKHSYSREDKFERISDNYEIGEVAVICYLKSYKSFDTVIDKNLVGTEYAIIRDFDNRSVTVEILHNPHTKAQQEVEFRNYSQEIRDLWEKYDSDTDDFKAETTTLSFDDTAIDFFTMNNSDDKAIIKLNQLSDEKFPIIIKEDGQYIKRQVSTKIFPYVVCKEYGISFKRPSE